MAATAGRRGRGHLQRAEVLLAGRRRSKFGDFLVESFCFGRREATDVQKEALLVVEDHADSPSDLKELADLGAKGKHPGNCHQQLMNLIKRRLPHAPDTTDFELPLNIHKGTTGEHVQNKEHSMIDPSRWWNYLYNRFPQECSRRFLGCDDGVADPAVPLRRFWDSIPEADVRKQYLRAYLLAQPGFDNEDDCWSRAVPLILHGDAVPTSNMSMTGISFSGLLGEGLSTVDAKNRISVMMNR